LRRSLDLPGSEELTDPPSVMTKRSPVSPTLSEALELRTARSG
jgi:hypothetical protein